MIVTSITPIDQKKKRVCVDGSYTFPLYLSEIRKFHIHEEEELSKEIFEEIHELLLRRLKDRILYYITDSDKTEKEVRRKMTGAYYPDDLIDSAVNWLKEYHYIDDERYARNYIRSLADYRRKPKNYILNKLYEKGISKDIIDCVIDEFPDVNEEEEMIRELLNRKGYTEDTLAELDSKNRQKLYAMLARKGYSTSQISHVLRSFDD